MQEEGLLNLRYWRELFSRQRWLVVGCIAGVTMAAGWLSALQEPVYEGVCRLYLSRQRVEPLSFDGLYSRDTGRLREQVATQAEVLQSRPILEMAARDLEERGILSFTPSGPTPPASWLNGILNRIRGRDAVVDETVDSRREAFVKALQRAMRVELAGGNAFVLVIVQARDPELAAELANAAAAAYLRNDKERLRRSSEDAISWLTGKIREQREKLLAAETRLRGLKHIPAEITEGGSDFAGQELGRIQQALLDVRLKLLETEARQAATASSMSEGVNGSKEKSLEVEVNSALRDKVRQDLVASTVALNQMRQRYGEKHPDVIKESEKVAELRDELARLGLPPDSVAGKTSPFGGMNSGEIEGLKAQEKALRDDLERMTSSSISKGQDAMGYAILRREVEINRALYNQMLGRLNEITISTGVEAPPAEIFERARPAESPISPDHRRNVLLGLMAGLLLGVGGAAVRDHLDQSVRDPAQANDLLRAPVLGVMPHYGRTGSSAGHVRYRLIVQNEPESIAAESYRILRSHIEGTLSQEDLGVLLMTSALPGEGKSSTAVNLAQAFAESGRRVLLVDADLRRPSLVHFFNASSEKCVTRVLSGESVPEHQVHSTEVANLDLLGCRTRGLYLDNLLQTERFRKLFDWARERYDRVVVDSPVVMATPGVTEMARAGCSVLLVHRPGWVPAQVLEQVRDHLGLSKTRLAGVILNGVKAQWMAGQYPLLPYYSATHRSLPRHGDSEPGSLG